MKLNLASGPNLFAGWVNIDRVSQEDYLDHLRKVEPGALETWPPTQRKLAEQVQAGLISCEVHDLRKGLPQYGDSSVDAIYLGQMVEHLNPLYELPRFLAECLRVLKPGAPIRVTTPDLSILMGAYMDGQMLKFAPEQPEWYLNAPPTAQLSYILFGACGPDCTFDNFEGHMACYTPEWFREVIERAGFVGVEFNGTRSAEFAECVDCGLSHSFCCEARKP